ncbi:hypothetical protein GCM10028824_06290 [Hymenobacter segetis]|uniref:T9SS type A sorting domain-containing protein n=1 Tax=Hymenobacter segetis TaxID=2025509 RepID=A0ABU9LXV7_9BACT
MPCHGRAQTWQRDPLLGRLLIHELVQDPAGLLWVTRYAAELVYYRLRQIDKDGTASYSPVRTVQVPATVGFAVQAYPQPFGPELNLLLRTAEAGPVTIVLHDAVGRALLTRSATLVAGSNVLQLPEAAAPASGVYVLSISHHASHRTLKIVRK